MAESLCGQTLHGHVEGWREGVLLDVNAKCSNGFTVTFISLCLQPGQSASLDVLAVGGYMIFLKKIFKKLVTGFASSDEGIISDVSAEMQFRKCTFHMPRRSMIHFSSV